MHAPHGPFKIGANRQITIPAELLRRINLEPGDSVYVAMDADIEGSLVVIPVERVVTWLEAGRRSESQTVDGPANERQSRRSSES